jgi:hypothetical protein
MKSLFLSACPLFIAFLPILRACLSSSFIRTHPTVVSYLLRRSVNLFYLLSLFCVCFSPFRVQAFLCHSLPSTSLVRMYITVNIWMFECKIYHTSKPKMKKKNNLNYTQVNQKVWKLFSCVTTDELTGRHEKSWINPQTNRYSAVQCSPFCFYLFFVHQILICWSYQRENSVRMIDIWIKNPNENITCNTRNRRNDNIYMPLAKEDVGIWRSTGVSGGLLWVM